MNKRLIALFISLVVVIVLIVSMSIAFTVGDVEVETTANVELTNEQIDTIISDSKIVKHASIFSLDEKIAMSNIELCNPTLKVVLIERKFPNKVSISITKRVPIFSLALKNGSFALLDRELKVVQIVDGVEEDYITPINGISLDVVQSGAFITTLEWLAPIVKSAESLAFVNKRFSSFIVDVNYQAFSSEEMSNMIQLKTNTGVVFAIAENQSKEAFNIYYTHYINNLTEDQKCSGYIVAQDEQIKWVASLI